MISPCNKVCLMDAEGRYCLGCARTLEEIARWSQMSDEERTAVLEALSRRRPAPQTFNGALSADDADSRPKRGG